MNITPSVIEVLHAALEEDIGHSDITTSLLIPEDGKSRARFIAKERFVLAGLPFVQGVFQILDFSIDFKAFYREGEKVEAGEAVAEVAGRSRAILSGERVSLNILQRLSGIASLTRMYVEKIEGLPVKIVDTRKTTPCQRLMEKYAVRVGGGYNHRFGLFDGILIKDNHIEAVGSVKEAIKRAKKGYHLSKIEVEVSNLQQLDEAIEASADIVMLDNMSVENIEEAVKIAKGRVIIEASGNIGLENVREIAEVGVDVISIGALTHSAVAADISLKIIKKIG